jgi:hypothetical protein
MVTVALLTSPGEGTHVVASVVEVVVWVPSLLEVEVARDRVSDMTPMAATKKTTMTAETTTLDPRPLFGMIGHRLIELHLAQHIRLSACSSLR